MTNPHKTVHFHFHAPCMIFSHPAIIMRSPPYLVKPPSKNRPQLLHIKQSSQKEKLLLLFTSNPPRAPPAGFPLLFWCCWRQVGEDLHPGKYLRITSPSSILHPLNSDSSHLIPPIHKDWTLEAGYLDPFHSLAIQGLWIHPCHFHAEGDILSPLVMMFRV